MVSHRSLMTILFQIRASGGNIFRESWITTKAPNSSFFFNGEPKYVTSWVIWVYLFTIYALHRNGITHRPHDHLFQISGVWVRHVPRKLVTKTANPGFFFNCEPQYITSNVIKALLFIVYVFHHNVITHRPHDHLFRKLGIWVHHVPWKLKNHNSGKFEFLIIYLPKYVTSWVIWVHLFII